MSYSRMVVALGVLSMCLLSTPSVAAEPTASQSSDLRWLLLVSGNEGVIRGMVSEVLDGARAGAEAGAKASGKPVDTANLERIAKAFDPEAILDVVVEIFGKHFPPPRGPGPLRILRNAAR